jgi:hypothetical protein
MNGTQHRSSAISLDPWSWQLTRDGNRGFFALARRHYSAKKNRRPKIRQSIGPGGKMALITANGHAIFAWRKFIDDSGQQGVNCAIFRNERGGCRNSNHDHCSSNLIQRADELAWERWPGERLYTYVDSREIQSSYPGYCFIRAGWCYVRDADGKPLKTKAGQHILECLRGEER